MNLKQRLISQGRGHNKKLQRFKLEKNILSQHKLGYAIKRVNSAKQAFIASKSKIVIQMRDNALVLRS